MVLKILHTGDVHLGMKYNNYPDYIREKLIEARFEVLKNITEIANKNRCNLLVIAGDLFDKQNIVEADIIKTIDLLSTFSGDCILVLPGNHDFSNSAVELWKKFEKHLSGNIVLLKEFKEYSLNSFDLEVSVFPAPCDSKHSSTNNLDWLQSIDKKGNNKFNIGVAHGALSGLSPDMTDSYFKMSREELNEAGLDLWLLGHTHLPFPEQTSIENRKIFNCGTPEPDGLDCSHQGSVWFIEIDEKKNIKARQIKTGIFNFLDLTYQINSRDDLEKLKEEILEGNPLQKVVRLNLQGRIPEEFFNSKEKFYRELKDELAYLRIDDSQLKIKITEEVIDNEFSSGSFPHRLLSALKDDEDALQLSYEFIRDVKK